jgi:hypothetical protein
MAWSFFSGDSFPPSYHSFPPNGTSQFPRILILAYSAAEVHPAAELREMTPQSPHRRKLIVLLSVTLLFTFGLLVRRWSVTRTPPQPTICQANLYRLDQAITRWAMDTHQKTTNIPTEPALQHYFPDQPLPRCLDGTVYQYGTLALATTCPRHGNAVLPPASQNGPSMLAYLHMKLGLKPNQPFDNCHTNLLILNRATQSWSLTNKKRVHDKVDTIDVATYLRSGQLPLCPAGGKYVSILVGNNHRCTITGHTLP